MGWSTPSRFVTRCRNEFDICAVTNDESYALVEESGAATDEVFATVRRGIREADPPSIGTRDWMPLCLSLRDAAGVIVGGVYGATMWRWLLIDGLWVGEPLRGQGHGRRLLRAAESTAVARGCLGAWLGTFDFQARGFYERHGYRVFGELADFPAGHTHYELFKLLEC